MSILIESNADKAANISYLIGRSVHVFRFGPELLVFVVI